jgi:hypothetical protein
MSDERLVVVVGDSLLTLRFPIEDAERKAVDLTGGSVRIFPNGQTASIDDKPTDVVGGNPTRTSVTLTAGSLTFTVSSGTGILEGMRPTSSTPGCFAPGTEVASVAGTTVTLNRPILQSGSSQTVTFWHGLACDLSEGANGIAKIQGLPAALRPGALERETYKYDLRYKTSGGKVGFSEPDEFDAITPVI